MLEYVPAHFKVLQTVRPKLSCTRCDVIVQHPAPSRPIDRGLAGPGLLAHVLVSKYADHLPLYRQSEIYQREGIELERATLTGWVGRSCQSLEPLVDALKQYVLDADKLHGDDIPVPVLAPGNGKPKRDGYGPMSAMTGLRPVPMRQPSGLRTHPTARVNIPFSIYPVFAASCKPTLMLASTASMKLVL